MSELIFNLMVWLAGITTVGAIYIFGSWFLGLAFFTALERWRH